ncbi:unnamed protein product [Brassica oleracea]
MKDGLAKGIRRGLFCLFFSLGLSTQIQGGWILAKESEEEYLVWSSKILYSYSNSIHQGEALLAFSTSSRLLYQSSSLSCAHKDKIDHFFDHSISSVFLPDSRQIIFSSVTNKCLMGDTCENSNRVKLRDGRLLAYRESGVPKEEAKYKIILVHGFGSSKDMNFSASKVEHTLCYVHFFGEKKSDLDLVFQELIQELGVYLLFYDRSGYGDSDANTKRSLKSEVDDIAELADHLEIGPKLSGVAFVAPVVNYRWPSLPKKLIKKDYRRGIIRWCLRISRFAPGLLHWWVVQKVIPSNSSVLESNPVYFNSHDVEVLKRTTGFPMLTKDKLRERNVFDTLRDDFVACFEQWDFEPADLNITQESSVHIWHGKEDKVVPFQLQRCILQKQPLINYHEIPQGGHLIVHYDGTCDAILRSLLLGEEHKMYKPMIRYYSDYKSQ